MRFLWNVLHALHERVPLSASKSFLICFSSFRYIQIPLFNFRQHIVNKVFVLRLLNYRHMLKTVKLK